ncbi:MAG TPA: peptidylprolyl isomerase [Longimicrobiales bacterium]|nr:peptidylprolyl isomerase [Longimicrobiales bacterium]
MDQAVDLLVDQENLPNETDVVRALADLWADYTLLAQEVARDSALSGLDLEPLVRDQVGQQMILQLRDSVIQVDTAVTEGELRNLYDAEAPEARLRARHILLSYPQQSSPAQRDSVRALLEGLRRRIQAGESFEALARQHSQDAASAVQGGDLGEFGRGEMVRPLEEAAFALEPGELSDIVESPYGLHLIRVDSKEAPGFEQMRNAFRQRVQSQRFLSAESVFVAGIEDRAEPETDEGAIEVLRELARDPATRLSGRAARRALVSYDGGAYTVGDYQRFMQTRAPQFRAQVANAPDEQLETFLEGLVRRQLLIQEARLAGLEPPRERIDSMVAEARSQLLQVTDEIGLRQLDRAPGESLVPPVQRAVRAALEEVLTGAADVVPLGQISYQLRARTPVTVSEAGVGEVILGVGEIRASRSPAPVEQAPDTASGPEGN